jgi:hypothetical protein
VPNKSEPSPAILREIGWVTVRWGALETYIDLLNAYLFTQANFLKAEKLPRPFSQRVRFIRRALVDPLFINLRAKGEALLDGVLKLSNERNQTVHGAVTRWADGHAADQILLKVFGERYFATTDAKLTLVDLEDLSWRIYQTEVALFNFNERIKSTVRLWKGDEEFFNVGYLSERTKR